MDIETFKLHGLDRAWGDLHAQDYQVNGGACGLIRQSAPNLTNILKKLIVLSSGKHR
tara:strand:- start:461 stop:631 length:171 start_codon:yes stop_codon:yes gene_type:complete